MLAAPNPPAYRNPERGLGNTPATGPLRQQWTPEASALRQGLDFATALNSPVMAGLQQQAGMYAGQFGMSQAGFDLARQAMMQGTQADQARLNLQPQYDQIEREAIYRQTMGLNDQNNLAYRQLGNQLEGFDLQQKSAWERTGQAQTAAKSDATVRGAMSGRGINRTMGDIQTDLANQLTGIDIGRDDAKMGFEAGQLSRAEQRAALADKNKMLDIKAQEYGISRQQIEASLSQGLAKLGLDQVADINRIMEMLSSNDIQQRAAAEQIFRQGLEYSDMFYTLPANRVSNSGNVVNGQYVNPVTAEATDKFMGYNAAPRQR